MFVFSRKTVWRQVLFILLAVLFYRQIDLPSPIVGACVYVLVGAAVSSAHHTTRRRLVFFLLSVLAIVVAAPLLVRAWRAIVPGVAADGAVVLWPYHVAFALLWVVPAWGSEIAALSGHRGKALFPIIFVIFSILVFSTETGFQTTIFPHPIWYAAFALTGVSLLLGAFVDRTGVPARLRSSLLWVLLLLAAAFALLLVFGRFQAKAVAARGGLIEPTLFRFDFSDYINLETEIRLGGDLVLIYHEENAPPDRLLRRYVLAGYGSDRGFFRIDTPDDAPAAASDETGGGRRLVEQEYYFVGFETSAKIAVNEPRRFATLETWDNASFNAIRRVWSDVLSIDESELRSAPPPDLERQSPEWKATYLTPSPSAPVAQLAEDITGDIEGYYDRVRAIQDYLLNEYWYSLSPGTASDGDQLSHFLFESKKGYCSYFAFAMALMARSQGIPARVAVGFFIDPESGLLSYYPIRENMAHAWVEVYFDEFGWVEFDPTSQRLAPGETFTPDSGYDPHSLTGLVEEILGAGDLLELTSGEAVVAPVPMRERFASFARNQWRLALLIVVAILWSLDLVPPLIWRTLPPDRRVALVFRRGIRRLARFGIRRTVGETYSEFAERVAARVGAEFLICVTTYQLIRFGSGVTVRDARVAEGAWRRVRRRACAGGRAPWARWVWWSLPFPVPARVIVLFLIVAFSTGPLVSVLSESVESYENRIWDAIDAENYERARGIIGSARTEHPEDPRFPLIEADLYFDRELYSLAEQLYRKALALGADGFSTRYDLARTLARQNRDDEAIAELEQLHRSYEPTVDTVSDLAWLYFKGHRNDDAIELVEGAIDRLGRERYLEMTLGTVWGAVWDFSQATNHYQWAIEDAKRSGDLVFEAVAEYNLSILETVFYKFDDAFASSNRSLAAAERPSGHLIRGELLEQRADYRGALEEYQKADALDRDTILPEINLVSAFLDAGYADRAAALLQQALAVDNPLWLYNYGTDLEQHTMRLNELRSDLLLFSSAEARLRPGSGLRTRINSARVVVRDRLLGWYFRGEYVRSSLRVARSLIQAGQELDAQWILLDIFKDKERIALPYLKRARELETAMIPESIPDYYLQEGQIHRDAEQIAEAYAMFDGSWQGYGRQEALKALLSLGIQRREPAVVQNAFALNRALFVRAGVRLPVTLRSGDGISEGVVRRALHREGIAVSETSPYLLFFTRTDVDHPAFEWRLTSRASGEIVDSGETVGSREADSRGTDRTVIREAAREIGDTLLRYDLPADHGTAEGQP